MTSNKKRIVIMDKIKITDINTIEKIVLERTYELEQSNQELIKANLELKNAEGEIFKLKKAIDQSANVVIITNKEGVIEYVNPKFTEVTGYTKQEALGANPSILKSEKLDTNFYVDLWKQISGGRTWEGEIHNLKKNKKSYWAYATISPVKNKKGEIINYIGIQEDITERKQITEELIKSKEKYKLISEATFEGICILINDEVIEVNQQLCEMFRCAKKEIFDMGFMNFIHPEDLQIVIENRLKKNTASYQFRGIRKDGKILYLELRGRNIIRNNKDYRILAIRDITKLKRNEIKIIESENRFRNIYNNSNVGIAISTVGGEIININAAFERMLEYTNEELFNKSFRNFTHPDDIDKDFKLLNKIKSGKIKHFTLEKRYITKSKQIIWGRLNVTCIRNLNNEIQNFVGLIENITEIKNKNVEILQAQISTEKNEKAKFAQEIHDGIGPILSTINLYFRWLAETDDPNKKKSIVTKGVKIIDEAIKSVKEISNNLSPHLLQNFGLIPALKAFTNRITETVTIKIDLNDNLENRLDDVTEFTLYRILTELINNTLKHASAKRIIINIFEGQNTVECEYYDDGIGFDYQEKVNRNNGFGILNIKNRIETLNGKFFIKSSKDKGIFVSFVLKRNTISR